MIEDTRQRCVVAISFALLWIIVGSRAEILADDAGPPTTLVIDKPRVVLMDVPVPKVVIRVSRESMSKDAASTDHVVQLHGLELVGFDDVDLTRVAVRVNGEPLIFESDLRLGRKVFISEDTIRMEGEISASAEVIRVNRWWSIVPPLLAIVLAMWIRNVFVALLAAVFVGATIILGGDVFTGLLRTVDSYLLTQLTPTRDYFSSIVAASTWNEFIARLVPVDGDYFQIQVVVFTLFLGATIGVMTESGGTRALVQRMARLTDSRTRCQLLTSSMGLAVFFDDYANMLLVGSTMRPVTDQQRISREKLAFLVDSTAAPVAGLSVISTWVAVEVGLIKDAFATQQLMLAGASVEDSAWWAFLWSLPYRFYPLLLLVFVFAVARTGRDFGPMRRAELRAFTTGRLTAGADPSVSTTTDINADSVPAFATNQPRLESLTILNAVLPIVVLVTSVIVGMLWQPDDSIRMLMYAAIAASTTAVFTAFATRALSISGIVRAWLLGVKSMLLGVVVLVLAWGIADVCSPDNLNTATFLVDLTGNLVSLSWMPALAFLLAAVVSFATGSSFATMGLLVPLFISMTSILLTEASVTTEQIPDNTIMLATIGAILAGAIFGDHCSPISDTTVLSSAASGCDHLDHVATQLPYALVVGAVALVFGYIPSGFGVSPWITLPVASLAVIGILRWLGRTPENPIDGPEVSPQFVT